MAKLQPANRGRRGNSPGSVADWPNEKSVQPLLDLAGHQRVAFSGEVIAAGYIDAAQNIRRGSLANIRLNANLRSQRDRQLF
jgi:hypothetical protein